MKKVLALFLAMMFCLASLSSAVLAEEAGEVPETATYSIHVLGDDWGCATDKVIIALDEPIEDAEAYDYTVQETLMAMDWATFSVGPVTNDKTIVDVYLCDETGMPVEGDSAFVALELYASPNEGSPLFTNNENFSLNEWSDPYYLTVTMEGEAGEVVVDEVCTDILTDTDMFELDSFTAEDGTEYQTALYSPEEEADTMVVWLHGIGEGGDDILLPLINADLGALVSEPFQSIMGGAYVLVPQCPIYWMDNDGKGGSFVDGGIQADGTSFYTESLHELIEAYKEMTGVDNIIIAGCSNGGYMTMVLAMNYGDEYQAYVPICEALEDSMISDEQIEVLAECPLYFIYAQNDPLVVPSVCEEPTIERLKAAGAEDLHVFAPADVHDTTGRFVGEDGEPLQAFGHGSWQYFFNNEAVDEDGVNCWEWMASFADEADADAVDTDAVEADVADTVRVDEVTVGSNDAFFYVPVGSDQLSVRTCSLPIFVVMGDEKYTAESVPEVAEKTGLKQLAFDEGAIVVFLNPAGDSWADEDLDGFSQIFTKFSDSSGENYVEGKTENDVYAGSLQRIYVFAEGDAADFAARNFNKQVSCFIDYGMYQLDNDVTPACTVLINPSVDMPETKEYDFDIPMAVVNPVQAEQAEAALVNLVPETGICAVAEGGFDVETVLPLYESLVSTVRRQSGVIVTIPDLEVLGMTEQVVTRPLSVGDITCYEYTSDAFEGAEEGTVPLVFMFHGGGNHAQYFAWASGWIDIAAEENLYLVSVDKHDRLTSAEVVELLDLLEEEHPQIDKSRIYATGFSMGAVKCWNLALKYPELFAGLLPCDAGYMSEGEFTGELEGITIEDDLEMKDVIIPIFYVAGGNSFTHEDVALDEQGNMNNVGVVLERIFAMNGVDDNYFYDAEKNVNWGLEPSETVSVEEPTFHTDLEISSFPSADGTVYTELCFDVQKGHETYPQDGVNGWDFIRQFSRAEDGSVIVD